MALVSKEHDVPQIAIPVGSRAEVEALGISTRNIATCSRRESATNFGCPMFERCDRDFRGERPQNEVVQIIGTTGDVRTVTQACFVTVRAEVDSEDKNTLVRVVGREGEKFKYRGSVKTHIKRDPDCNECAQGRCEKYHDTDTLEGLCKPFPAATEHPELRRFGRRVEARQANTATKKAAKERRLLGPEDTGAPARA